MTLLPQRGIVYSLLIIVTCFIITSYQPAQAAIPYPLPSADNDVIGEVKYVSARNGEVLSDIARRNGLGINEIIQANPKLPPNRRLKENTQVLIPTQFILPAGEREGIVVNLAELRVYYYPKGENIVITAPVGIGREGGWQTPIGTTTVTSKQTDPAWRPPQSVRAEAARMGTPIPAYFPPGPNNPLGQHTLRFGWPAYLMHGTNRPEGVGARVSAGCIRMYPEDIEYLHEIVPIGTTVRIVNEPFKVGWLHGKLYFEAHQPLSEQEERYSEDMSGIVDIIHAQTDEHSTSVVKWSAVRQIAQYPSGIPQQISQ